MLVVFSTSYENILREEQMRLTRVELRLKKVNSQWSMVNGQWSMVNGQWSMVNKQTQDWGSYYAGGLVIFWDFVPGTGDIEYNLSRIQAIQVQRF